MVDDKLVMLVNSLLILVVLFKMLPHGSGVPGAGVPVSGAPTKPLRVVYKVLMLVIILLPVRLVWNTSVCDDPYIIVFRMSIASVLVSQQPDNTLMSIALFSIKVLNCFVMVVSLPPDKCVFIKSQQSVKPLNS